MSAQDARHIFGEANSVGNLVRLLARWLQGTRGAARSEKKTSMPVRLRGRTIQYRDRRFDQRISIRIIESPLIAFVIRSRKPALSGKTWTMAPICSCHLATGNCEVRIKDRSGHKRRHFHVWRSILKPQQTSELMFYPVRGPRGIQCLPRKRCCSQLGAARARLHGFVLPPSEL